MVLYKDAKGGDQYIEAWERESTPQNFAFHVLLLTSDDQLKCLCYLVIFIPGIGLTFRKR